MALVTIGYEAYGLAAFIDRLTAEGVTTLIDIRQIANSRCAVFSKRKLQATLAEAGVG